MNISELSIRRPVLSTVLTLIILLFGLIGYSYLGVREYPSVDNPIISEIVASYSSYEKWSNGREVTYNNSNELLDPNSPYYRPEVIGLKTGTSSLGGACIVSAAVMDGETYICVVMGSTKESRFQDSVDILDKIKAQ